MKFVGNIFPVKDLAVNVKVINQASTTKTKRVQEHKIRIGEEQTGRYYVRVSQEKCRWRNTNAILLFQRIHIKNITKFFF